MIKSKSKLLINFFSFSIKILNDTGNNIPTKDCEQRTCNLSRYRVLYVRVVFKISSLIIGNHQRYISADVLAKHLSSFKKTKADRFIDFIPEIIFFILCKMCFGI